MSSIENETVPVAPIVDAVAPASDASGPRVRWAGILWGLALAAIAAAGIWVLSDPDRQAAGAEWLLDLGPAAAVAYGVLAIGALALIAGLVGVARRIQRSAERRRAASARETASAVDAPLSR